MELNFQKEGKLQEETTRVVEKLEQEVAKEEAKTRTRSNKS